MQTGLDVLLSDVRALRGLRVGLCCNHTAVTAAIRYTSRRHLEPPRPARPAPARRPAPTDARLTRPVSQQAVAPLGEGTLACARQNEDLAPLSQRVAHRDERPAPTARLHHDDTSTACGLRVRSRSVYVECWENPRKI